MWGFSQTMDGNALSAFRLVHRVAQSKKKPAGRRVFNFKRS